VVVLVEVVFHQQLDLLRKLGAQVAVALLGEVWDWHLELEPLAHQVKALLAAMAEQVEHLLEEVAGQAQLGKLLDLRSMVAQE